MTLQAKHRRIRRWDVLWAVYDASLRWRALQRRREAREVRYRESLGAAPAEDQEALREALDALLAADSLEARLLPPRRQPRPCTVQARSLKWGCACAFGLSCQLLEHAADSVGDIANPTW